MHTYGEAGTALARPPASSRRRCLNAAMRLPPRLLFPFAPTHCQNLCQARILPCFYKSIQVSNDGGATWSRISATVLLQTPCSDSDSDSDSLPASRLLPQVQFLFCDIYVGPSGSDLFGLGTPDRPYRTLQRGVAAALQNPRSFYQYKPAAYAGAVARRPPSQPCPCPCPAGAGLLPHAHYPTRGRTGGPPGARSVLLDAVPLRRGAAVHRQQRVRLHHQPRPAQRRLRRQPHRRRHLTAPRITSHSGVDFASALPKLCPHLPAPFSFRRLHRPRQRGPAPARQDVGARRRLPRRAHRPRTRSSRTTQASAAAKSVRPSVRPSAGNVVIDCQTAGLGAVVGSGDAYGGREDVLNSGAIALVRSIYCAGFLGYGARSCGFLAQPAAWARCRALRCAFGGAGWDPDRELRPAGVGVLTSGGGYP